MRVAILGNAGSGKSTLARWVAERTSSPLLDLDTVAWEPGAVAMPRSLDAAEHDVAAFCAGNHRWVVEGCYANLVGVALRFTPTLVLLNPGEARCLANCRARPWEQHKYASKNEQDERLSFLLTWVREYYTRSGEMSLVAHVACFESYTGPKVHLSHQPVLDTPSPAVLALVG